MFGGSRQSVTEPAQDPRVPDRHRPTRRAVLRLALGMGLVLPFVKAGAAAEADPRGARPREGDRFVFATGARQGHVVAPSDLLIGGPPEIGRASCRERV